MAGIVIAGGVMSMKQLVWLVLLVSATVRAESDCAHTSRERYVSGWEEVDAEQRLHRRITPDAAVNCSYFPDQSQKLNVLARYEQGVLNGAEYKVYYTDGSAVIQGEPGKPLANADHMDNWKLVCRQSRQSGPYQCTLSKGDLLLRKMADGTLTLNIGEHQRANSQLLLRVDTQWAVTAPAETGFSAEQTTQLVEQMLAGKHADTRYQSALRQGPSDKTISLFGFNQALEILDDVLDQLNAAPADQRQ
jgi:hypothetical protein